MGLLDFKEDEIKILVNKILLIDSIDSYDMEKLA